MSTNYDRIRAHGVELVTGIVGFKWEGVFYPLPPYLSKIFTKLLDRGIVYQEEIARRPTTGAVYVSHLRKALREVRLPFVIKKGEYGTGSYTMDIEQSETSDTLGDAQYERDHPTDISIDSLQNGLGRSA